MTLTIIDMLSRGLRMHRLKIAMAAVALAAGVGRAQQPAAPPATIMTAARLAQLGDSLTPGTSRTAQLGRAEGYTWAMTHRDSSGGLEVHRGFTDVFVMVAGSSTLVSGGTVAGARETTPGEWRGGTATGGTSVALHVGDVVVIPAGAPHQMFLAPGERVSYLAFKIAAPFERVNSEMNIKAVKDKP